MKPPTVKPLPPKEIEKQTKEAMKSENSFKFIDFVNIQENELVSDYLGKRSGRFQQEQEEVKEIIVLINNNPFCSIDTNAPLEALIKYLLEQPDFVQALAGKKIYSIKIDSTGQAIDFLTKE